jgi:hypothetical protein
MDVRDLCAFAVDSIIDNMDGMAEDDIIKQSLSFIMMMKIASKN